MFGVSIIHDYTRDSEHIQIIANILISNMIFGQGNNLKAEK